MYLVSTTIFVLMFYFAKIVQAERKDKQGERKKGLVRFFRTAAGFIKKQNETK
jgi:hypothetical protein